MPKIIAQGIIEQKVKALFGLFHEMEDSLFLYSNPRDDSEKRVWVINTGSMPKPKAEKFMKEQARKLRRRVDYNTKTGEVVTIT